MILEMVSWETGLAIPLTVHFGHFNWGCLIPPKVLCQTPEQNTDLLLINPLPHCEFAARDNRPAVTLKWYEGGYQPEIKPEWGINKLDRSGMLMIGDKKTLLTGGRPNNPRLLVSPEEWEAFQKTRPKKQSQGCMKKVLYKSG